MRTEKEIREHIEKTKNGSNNFNSVYRTDVIEVLEWVLDTPATELCKCGHSKKMHVYHVLSCRSGQIVCPCEKYEPASPVAKENCRTGIVGVHAIELIESLEKRSCETCGNSMENSDVCNFVLEQNKDNLKRHLPFMDALRDCIGRDLVYWQPKPVAEDVKKNCNCYNCGIKKDCKVNPRAHACCGSWQPKPVASPVADVEKSCETKYGQEVCTNCGKIREQHHWNADHNLWFCGVKNNSWFSNQPRPVAAPVADVEKNCGSKHDAMRKDGWKECRFCHKDLWHTE